MAWIELHQSRQRHPKTLRLAAALGISRREACGLLDDLWTWALDAARIDGLLLGMSATDIAVALDYPHKQGAKLLDALTLSGYMDVTDGGEYALHDWYDYAGKLNDRRQRDAEYQRKKRTTVVLKSPDVGTTSERHRAVPYPTVPNSTVPNSTVPNSTVPNSTVPNQTISEGGNGAASPRPSPARFTPPSLDEVRAYCKERENRVDPEKWHDFYTAKGWKVGNQAMKDWKAAVRTWEQREDRRNTNEEHRRSDGGGNAGPAPGQRDDYGGVYL